MKEPKIYLTLKGKRTKYYKGSTKRRIAGLLASEAVKKLLKNGVGRLHFIYGKDKEGLITNTIVGNLSDIKWGLDAFGDSDLYL